MARPDNDFWRSNLFAGLLFQAALIPLALFLAWPLGLPLLGAMHLSWALLFQTLAGTAAIFLLYGLLMPFTPSWGRELEQKVRNMLTQLFRHRSIHWALPLSILAGVGEELLFRGVLQQALAQWLNAPVAILATGLLFGLVHAISRAYFIVATLMGIYMGLLFHWSGNLLLPILIHALYDWLAILYYRSARLRLLRRKVLP
ncbi:CPBP family intramembrane glutamic endopeptidase [Natronospira bacteriovora]|uniref:Type II CAAX endopeptidase family protein n=1 Tax=Natronospira bacteriovora TaxID=3069753 RepID=A0ABU0W7N9_9GAMM|nr:type II CAAX endopeptidase family protein [Natronospira sp. AB-CW4]MDQ2070047.1 type II CAAX endopeptidase family protein [Natronospira sp. AB-CW4]